MPNDLNISRETYEIYRFYRDNGHDDVLDRMETAQLFYACDQWTQDEISKLKAQGRPHLTMNEIFRTMQAVLGEMSQQSVDIKFAPDGEGDEGVADAFDKLYMHVSARNKMEALDNIVRMRGMVMGRGYYDVRMDFDNSMKGHIKVSAPRPQNIILNPEIESVDPNDWPDFFRVRLMSLNDIEMLYGDRAADDVKHAATPNWVDIEDRLFSPALKRRIMAGFDYTGADARNIRPYRVLERQYRDVKMKDFFVDPATGDMKEVPENWDRERINHLLNNYGLVIARRKAQTIRWRCVCDDVVLHDEDSPYSRFTIVPYMPFFIDGHTMSLTDHMIDPQRLLNKTLSQELHILNTTANSGWKVKSGALLNMTPEELEERGAETGLVAVLTEMDALEKIEANSMPTGHDTIVSRAIEFVRHLGGATDAMFGQTRPDAAAKLQLANAARGPINLTLPISAFYFTKVTLAENIRDLIQTYYTEPRVVRITSETGQIGEPVYVNQPQSDADQVLNDITVGEYMVQIVPGPARATIEQNAFDQLVKLKELGVVIPDSVMLRFAQIPKKVDIMKEIQEGAAPPEQQEMMRLELEMLRAEVAKKVAEIAGVQSSSQLDQARATKALSDAQHDDKADRVRLEQARLSSEHVRGMEQIKTLRRNHSVDASLKLIELNNDKEQMAQKAADDKKKAAKPTTPKKAKA
jgi:hypothetical protein